MKNTKTDPREEYVEYTAPYAADLRDETPVFVAVNGESLRIKRGETVRIKDGAFENIEGKIQSIDNERGKLQLMVSILGRSTPLELEFWQVEHVV